MVGWIIGRGTGHDDYTICDRIITFNRSPSGKRWFWNLIVQTSVHTIGQTHIYGTFSEASSQADVPKHLLE